MQATTIQALQFIDRVEMVLRRLLGELEPQGPCASDPASVPNDSCTNDGVAARFKSPNCWPSRIARRVGRIVYRSAHKNNYFADRSGSDVLTDTTERSADLCTPPFSEVRWMPRPLNRGRSCFYLEEHTAGWNASSNANPNASSG